MNPPFYPRPGNYNQQQIVPFGMPRMMTPRPVYQEEDIISETSETSEITNPSYVDANTEVESDDIRNIKTVLKEWLVIDTKIAEANTKLRQLRNTKTELQQKIVEFMNENGIEELKTPNDDILLKEKNTKRMITSRNLVGMLQQLSIDKNIPALRNFLSSAPLEFTKKSTAVQRKHNS